MCCCCEEGECCEFGFFAHAFVLCFTAGFALSRDVFECSIPGLSYTSAPGVIHKQVLCCYTTKSWTPAPTLPVNFWCLCNLCLCGFDLGNYRETSSSKSEGEPTIISAPIPQQVSRHDPYPSNHSHSAHDQGQSYRSHSAHDHQSYHSHSAHDAQVPSYHSHSAHDQGPSYHSHSAHAQG